MKVLVNPTADDGVERALKKLKKKLFDDGRIRDLTERRYYEKRSVSRRRKKLAAKRRNELRVQAEKERFQQRTPHVSRSPRPARATRRP